MLSGALSKDLHWLDWHFSRLGEGHTIASTIFNISLFISGLIMFMIAFTIRNRLLAVYQGNGEYKKAAKLFFILLLAIGACLISLALLPFDRFSLLHNIAGYSLLACCAGLAVSSSITIPTLSRRYRAMPAVIIAVAVILYIPYFTINKPSLILIEFILFVLIYIWFIMFTNSILKNKNKHR